MEVSAEYPAVVGVAESCPVANWGAAVVEADLPAVCLESGWPVNSPVRLRVVV